MEAWDAALFYFLSVALTSWVVGLERQNRKLILPALAVSAGLAFVGGFILLGSNVASFRAFLFYLFSFLAVSSALLMVTGRNPVHSALWLISVILSVAVIMVLMHAEFFAAVQVIVYAGAIMILYLFTIMMVEMPEKPVRHPWIARHTMATALGVVLFGAICAVLARRPAAIDVVVQSRIPNEEGNTVALGRSLFTEYLLPFEVASILLLVALVGAIVLARKEKGETEASMEGFK